MDAVARNVMKEKGVRISPASYYWKYKGDYYISPEGMWKRKRGAIGLLLPDKNGMTTLEDLSYPLLGNHALRMWDFIKVEDPKQIEKLKNKYEISCKRRYIVKFQKGIYLKKTIKTNGYLKIYTTPVPTNAKKMRIRSAQKWQNILLDNGNYCVLNYFDSKGNIKEEIKGKLVSRFELIDINE